MKRIGILTGGGDVPGLNAAIKSFVWRMLDEDCEILGLRRGWASLTNIIPDESADNSSWIMPLTRANTRAIDRTGGTILHTSRINPEISKAEHIPPHPETEKGEPHERGIARALSRRRAVRTQLRRDVSARRISRGLRSRHHRRGAVRRGRAVPDVVQGQAGESEQLRGRRDLRGCADDDGRDDRVR